MWQWYNITIKKLSLDDFMMVNTITGWWLWEYIVEPIHSTTFRYIVMTYYCKICAHERSLEGLQYLHVFSKIQLFVNSFHISKKFYEINFREAITPSLLITHTPHSRYNHILFHHLKHRHSPLPPHTYPTERFTLSTQSRRRIRVDN